MTTTTTSSFNLYTDSVPTALAYEWSSGDRGGVSYGHLDIPLGAVAEITIYEPVGAGQVEYTTHARMMGHGIAGPAVPGCEDAPATYWVQFNPDHL